MTKLAAFGLMVTLPVSLSLVLGTQSQPNTRVDTGLTVGVDPLLAKAIFAPGRVEGVTPELDLRPEIAGRMTELLVREGQMVQQGEPLLRVQDAQLRCNLEIAEADVELARAQLQRLENGACKEELAELIALWEAKEAELERARRDWQRNQPLVDRKAITTQRADQYRTSEKAVAAEVAAAKARYEKAAAGARPDEIRIAEARVLAAKARMDEARAMLEQAQVRSPCAGQILKVNAEVGEMVGPDSTQPAIVMVDTSRFCVRAFVEELDAPKVTEGMTVRVVADGLPGQEFAGQVSHVSPRMSQKTLWTNDPTEKSDTKVREICIVLDGTPPFVVGLPVDAYVELEQPIMSGNPAGPIDAR